MNQGWAPLGSDWARRSWVASRSAKRRVVSSQVCRNLLDKLGSVKRLLPFLAKTSRYGYSLFWCQMPRTRYTTVASCPRPRRCGRLGPALRRPRPLPAPRTHGRGDRPHRQRLRGAARGPPRGEPEWGSARVHFTTAENGSVQLSSTVRLESAERLWHAAKRASTSPAEGPERLESARTHRSALRNEND